MNQLVARSPAPPVRSVAAPASLVELLLERAVESFDRPAIVDPLAAGAPCWTWGELAAAALHVADALAAAGLRPGDRVAHVGPHAPDWIAFDLACLAGGFVHVAMHADTSPAERARIARWTEARGVVTGEGERWSGAAGGAIVHGLGDLGGLGTGAWRGLAADRRGLEATLRRRAAACDPDACAVILLSSGTTGEPHGVLHSQRSLAANAAAAADVFLDDPRDVRLAWLPLSHALARTGDLATALVRGGCLSVVGDRTRVLEACAALPPTVILGVPAFFERLEQAARAGRIADLAAALGGRVRACVSGGAPLRRRTAEFFAARGVPLVEGYGLAEAGPVVAVANPRIARPGTVGPPLDGVEVRIDDRPESRGQVLVRTPSLALGVIVPPDSTVRPAVRDGWLETGDAGTFDEAGHLRITGRLRDVVVLSTGAKIPPAAVERVLAEDEHVAQVCVVGDGLPWPVALVVPEPAALRAALGRLGARVASRRAALAHPRLLAWLARRLARRQRELPRAWQVRRLVLVGRPFDAAHGEATAAHKLVRAAVAGNFRDRIAAAALPAPPAWAAVVPGPGPGRAVAAPAAARPWLAGAVWRSDDGGFAAAAARAATAPPERVAATVAEAERVIAALRAADALYDPPTGPAPVPAPLDDAPPPPAGTFSRAAEEALGRAGLWGLAVPVEHGGAGATHLDLVRAITRLAVACPTAAGMLAVHSSIGAVSALVAFGTADQRARHLPGLAAGRPLSVFGGTEPDAGCDLGAVRAVLERRDGGLVLHGTKMFITGATHGRLVKVLARLDGVPTVALVRLPEADGPTFRLRRYAIHPLKHAHNAALEFTAHPVAAADLLAAPGADGMRIVWHGLDRGRGTLAAQAAGTLRLLLVQARARALERSTWGRPIASRELVRGRLGRIAAGVAACDAVAAWAAAAVDAGGGDLEAIVAKVTASTCVREAALDALGVHGGRAFLVGHPLGDSLHDHLAVTVYEGESDLLGLALFKGIAKRHPLVGPAADATPLRRAGQWLAWRAARLAASEPTDRGILDRQLRDHARRARRLLARTAARIDAALRRHGRGLAERQLEVGALAADVRELASVLAVAHHADAGGGDTFAAECWCRSALRRVWGGRPTAADHAALAALGARVVAEASAVPAP